MKTSEKIFTALMLVLAGFFIIGIANFQLILIPRIDKPETIQIFHFVCTLLGLYAATLATTSVINLKQKKLGTVSTVIQIMIMFLIAYGIPLAIWGIVLLVKRNKIANQGVDPTLKTPVDSVNV